MVQLHPARYTRVPLYTVLETWWQCDGVPYSLSKHVCERSPARIPSLVGRNHVRRPTEVSSTDPYEVRIGPEIGQVRTGQHVLPIV